MVMLPRWLYYSLKCIKKHCSFRILKFFVLLHSKKLASVKFCSMKVAISYTHYARYEFFLECNFHRQSHSIKWKTSLAAYLHIMRGCEEELATECTELVMGMRLNPLLLFRNASGHLSLKIKTAERHLRLANLETPQLLQEEIRRLKDL